MGLFDFIGDALGAMAAPFTAVIDAGTKLLGLPPVVGDALKSPWERRPGTSSP